MKSIFISAKRTLASLKTDEKLAAALHSAPELNNALHSFVSANRGHQHKLGTPLLRLEEYSNFSCYASLSESDRAIRNTFKESLLGLTQALTRLDEPASAELSCVFDEVDDSGNLEYLFCRALSGYGAWLDAFKGNQPKADPPFKRGTLKVSPGIRRGDNYEFEISAESRHGHATAKEEVRIEAPAAWTLREYWKLSRKLYSEVRKAYQRLCQAKCFSEQAQTDMYLDEMRVKLADYLMAQPANLRPLILSNWNSLKPSRL